MTDDPDGLHGTLTSSVMTHEAGQIHTEKWHDCTLTPGSTYNLMQENVQAQIGLEYFHGSSLLAGSALLVATEKPDYLGEKSGIH